MVVTIVISLGVRIFSVIVMGEAGSSHTVILCSNSLAQGIPFTTKLAVLLNHMKSPVS